MTIFSDGGQAFPRITEQESNRTDAADYRMHGESGASLRDYFAAKALQGVLAAEAHPKAQWAIPVDDGAAEFIALNVYKYADAMLKVRESRNA